MSRDVLSGTNADLLPSLLNIGYFSISHVYMSMVVLSGTNADSSEWSCTLQAQYIRAYDTNKDKPEGL